MLLPKPAVLGYLEHYTKEVIVCQGFFEKYFNFFEFFEIASYLTIIPINAYAKSSFKNSRAPRGFYQGQIANGANFT